MYTNNSTVDKEDQVCVLGLTTGPVSNNPKKVPDSTENASISKIGGYGVSIIN